MTINWLDERAIEKSVPNVSASDGSTFGGEKLSAVTGVIAAISDA